MTTFYSLIFYNKWDCVMSNSKEAQKIFVDWKFPVKYNSHKERILDPNRRHKITNLIERETRKLFKGDVAIVLTTRMHIPPRACLVIFSTGIYMEEDNFMQFRDKVSYMSKVVCRIMGIPRVMYTTSNPVSKYQCIKEYIGRDDYVYGNSIV